MRNARSNARATSRCRDEAHLAPLREPDPHREPARRPSSGDQLHRATEDRLRPRDRSRGPGRCPGCRPPAAPPTPRRARARSRCTPRSRSTASTGNRGARARRAPPASPARGSPGAARPRCGPTGRISSSVRCRVTYQSGSRPSAAIASIQRSSWKCSLHSWNVPPARHTRSMTRPIRRSPRLAIPSAKVAAGSCQRMLRAGALQVVAQQPDLALQLLRRRSARTTGTACAPSARSRRPTRCSSPASCTCARPSRPRARARRSRACPRPSRSAGRRGSRASPAANPASTRRRPRRRGPPR